MKRSRTKLPSRLDGLSIFAGAKPESYDAVVERAQERIRQIKETYGNQHLTFEYNNEVIRGEFVDAVEGDFPGTLMVVLRIRSSRICSGPCFLRLGDERVSGIVVTARGGIVGITSKALPQQREASVPHEHSLQRCA